MNPNMKFYISIFLRRLPLFLLAFVTFSTVGIFLASSLPPAYETSATLLIEDPDIGERVIDPTEQTQIIEQRLMTRANLLEVARSFNVYGEDTPDSPDAIISKMEKDIYFRATSGREKATLMEISFSGRSPDIVTKVTNDLVTRIQSNTRSEDTQREEENAAFYQTRVDRLNTELDLKSAQILAFQNANSDALPDSLEYRLGRQALLQERLAQTARDIASIREQRARVVQIFEATGDLASTSQGAQTPEQAQLSSLKSELNSALSIYSDSHPNVKRLKAQISNLEPVVAKQGVVVTGNADASLLDVQLAELDGRIEFLEKEDLTVREELELLDISIRRTPENRINLEALERDYENTKEQYNRAISDLDEAKKRTVIVELGKGQKVSVIEQATRPTEPSSPNRVLIAGGGITAGFMIGLALIVLMEVLNNAIRRPIELTNGLGITPIATIPYIKGATDSSLRRMLSYALALLIVIGVPALLYYIHTYVMPLDLIIARIL